MVTLPTWMRGALFATAAMNVVGGIAFLPPAHALRAIGGMPDGGHPLYPTALGALVLVFAVAYLWLAMTGRADRLFIAVATAGKLSFFASLAWFWAVGALPLRAPLAGIGDLVFGVMFSVWLYGGTGAGAEPAGF